MQFPTTDNIYSYSADTGNHLSYVDNRLDNRPVLLFMHGWDCTRETMQSIYQPLSLHYRVIAVDLPGFGESSPLDGCPGCEEYAEFIVQFCKSLGINQIIVIGHSFGGKIGLVLAAVYRDLVQKLVLIDASGIKPYRSPLYYWRVYTWKMAKWILLNLIKNEMAFKRLQEKTGSTDYRSAGPMRKVMVKVVNQHYDHLLKNIVCPVFLYWGEKDRDTPLWMAKKMESRLADAALYVVKGGGHYSFLDDPTIIRIIETFAQERE